jgi:hypothetical protein
MGQLVIGDHNMTVWAEQSVVTIVQPGERREPRRRPTIGLLPRRANPPIGRDRELAALRQSLAADRLVQMHGAAGAGKSTLLRYVAGQLAGAGAGVVFLSAAGRDPTDLLQDVFEACYDAPGYRPTEVELRRLMAGVDIRLLIDDLAQPPDERAALLDGAPDASVLFTSAERTVWHDGQAVVLAGLDREPAAALLASALGRPLREQELTTAEELWQASDGLPLLLLRAAAAAQPGPDGTPTLPRAAQLAELLPRVLATASGPAREAVAVLGIAGTPVISPVVLPWLVSDPITLPAALRELTALGVVLDGELGYQLAAGVADALPDDLASAAATVERVANGLCTWTRSAQLAPQLVADHAALIGSVIDATVSVGLAGLGARLAKATAPFAACSLRLGAWERILGRGKVAAERAGDRSVLAYLTHEDGIRSLVTGKRVAAAVAIGVAAAIWHQLGETAHVALAQQTQAIAGPSAAHAGTAGHTAISSHASQAAHTGHSSAVHASQSVHAAKGAAGTTKAATVAAKGAGVGAKAGLGLGAKLTIAGVATVAIGGGGYLGVHALLPASHAAPAAPAAPGLTGRQLASALLPQADFPDNFSLDQSSVADSGATLTSAAHQHDLATMACTDLAPAVFRFTAGFGESAFATNSHVSDPVSNQAAHIDQAVYQFPSTAAASAFFAGLRKVLSACVNPDANQPAGSAVDTTPVNGHPAITTTITPILRTSATNVDLYGQVDPFYVLDGDYVYAIATGVGRNSSAYDYPLLGRNSPELIPLLIRNVDRLNPAAEGGTSSGASPTDASTSTPASSSAGTANQPTGPVAVVQDYFAAINARDYQRAWVRGGKNTNESYAQFVAGFADTDHDTLTIVGVQGDVVTVDFTAVHTDGTQQTFSGTYTATGDTITTYSVHRTG